MACSHPNQLRGTDGVLRCLTCGQAVEEAEPRTESVSGRNIGFDAEPEKKPAKRTAKKKAEA